MPLDPSITLQPHQQRLRDRAEEAERTGVPLRVLGNWSTGSGKTLGALGAVDALGGDATYVVPAALRENLRAEAVRSIGKSPEVYSYQGAVAGKAPATKTLVADEAQRLTSPGSQQAAAVKDLAGKSKNVILLSGTPIRNDPSEFAPLMSILTGRDINHQQFKDRYIGTERTRPGGLMGWFRGEPVVERPVLRHTDELKALLAGKIDYYSSPTENVDGARVTHRDVETEMTPRQADLYNAMWNKLPFLMRWKMRHRYDLTPEEINRFKSFMTGPRQVALSDLPFRTDGDAAKAFDSSGKLTKAFQSMQETLADPRRKGIVYSNFVDAGLKPYAAALDRAKIPYGFFSGALNDAQRKEMVESFNSGKHRVALVAPAGAEGISLKGSQKIQLLDPYWNDARMRQAQARGIRYDSHTGLPEDLRGVEVERYVARLPLGVKGRLLAALGVDRESQRATVDDHLRLLASRKERLNVQFLELLKEIAEADKLPRQQVNEKRASVTIPGTDRYPVIAQNGGPVASAEQQRVRVVIPHGDGQYLMEKLTNPKYPTRLGKTRFPGGGIEEGETPEQAAARELKEELGATIDPKAFKHLGVVPHHEWGYDEHYLHLPDHGLSPGVFDNAVGGDKQVTLVSAHPSGPDYWGPDVSHLLGGPTSLAGGSLQGAARSLAVKKLAAAPLAHLSGASGSGKSTVLNRLSASGRVTVRDIDEIDYDAKKALGYPIELNAYTPEMHQALSLKKKELSDAYVSAQYKPVVLGGVANDESGYDTGAPTKLMLDVGPLRATLRAYRRDFGTEWGNPLWKFPKHYRDNRRIYKDLEAQGYEKVSPDAAVARLTDLAEKVAIAIEAPTIGTGHMTIAAAGGADTITALRLAKQYSDQGAYDRKLAILREMIQAAPQDFRIDSDQGYTVGITHNTGWRYHLPARSIADLPIQRRIVATKLVPTQTSVW